jgi:competence ComEA-like helix-hairpin-helix protein
MNFLTKEERLVLLSLAFVILLGATGRFLSKQSPRFWKALDFINAGVGPSCVEINTATLEQLIGIPYIGPVTAGRILDYRTTHGPFQSKEQLKEIQGIGLGLYERILPFIKIAEEKTQ